MSLPKTLLLEVTNGGLWEGPCYAWVTLTEAQRNEIARLSEGAKALGVFKVCRFDYTPKWGDLLEEPQTGAEIWRLEPDEVAPFKAAFKPARVDCPVLNVNDDGSFYWTAYERHSDVRLETATLTPELFETEGETA